MKQSQRVQPSRGLDPRDYLVLKIKRGALFIFSLTLFLFPGQSWYLVAQPHYRFPQTRAIELQIPHPADYPVYSPLAVRKSRGFGSLIEAGAQSTPAPSETGDFNFKPQEPPSLTAQAVTVIDRDSATLIYGKNEDLEVLPASTVKIMSALVALDYYKPDDFLVASKIKTEGQDMGLVEGEEIQVENLLYGLLVSSANDAAWVLAQNYPGEEKGFVDAMNKKAEELHLKDTHFANPAGLESDEQGNFLVDFSYTTPFDLAHLANWAIRDEIFAKIVATPKITVSDRSGQVEHQLTNINALLGIVPGMKGVKTGWTEKAGECLVGYTQREGRGIITVVLGSEDRFKETGKLIDWVFENYRWQRITTMAASESPSESEGMKRSPVPDGAG